MTGKRDARRIGRTWKPVVLGVERKERIVAPERLGGWCAYH